MNTVDLYAQQLGEPGAPPLVIAHGLLGSSTNWGSIGRRLAASYSVALLDLRNHGRSAHAQEMSYPAMAADIAAWLDASGLDQVTLIGHSMGGKAAMWLALTQPQRLSRLVVVDIAPRTSPGDHRSIIRAMATLELDAIDTRADADRALTASIPEQAVRAWLLQNLVIDAQGTRWRINMDAIAAAHSTLTGWPDTSAVAPFRRPTLFVRGANSDYLRDDDAQRLAPLFPEASIATIAHAGHWLHAEQPAAFVGELERFLGAAVRPA